MIDFNKIIQYRKHMGLRTPGCYENLPARDVLPFIRKINEELSEYAKAADEYNLVKVADGLGDLLFAVLEAGAAHGLPMDEVFDTIWKSKMTKKKPGKKGKKFEKPDFWWLKERIKHGK